jgi:aspartate carbamoyltransferase catalytic subunit
MTSQRHANGTLRHLLTLEDLSRAELEMLLERAQHFSRGPGEAAPRSDALAGVTVANMFTEPSTRTRVSFELAAKRLGAEVVNLEMELSSRAKGESMLDTIFTLQALHVDVFVLRDAEVGVPAMVAAHVAPQVSVLSAGEAHVSHPTQGLLDALTVLQKKGRCDGLSIAIVGDIRHSRVARSAYQAFRTLGAGDLRIVAPSALMPEPEEFTTATRCTDIAQGIAGADVVMMLRIQKERFGDAVSPVGDEYFREFGLTTQRLALAKPDAIVMHPGPINRGVELDPAIADGPRSVILEQVARGVAIRMAVLYLLGGGQDPSASTSE